MLSLKVPLKDAEKWKNYLLMNDLLDKRYRFDKDKGFIYYPIKNRFNIVALTGSELSFVDKKFYKNKLPGDLRESLRSRLNVKELELLQTAHDTVGNIAILEIPDELKKRERLIARTLLKMNSSIKTVLKKAASHEGTFRTQKMTYLAGAKTKVALYKENNVTMKLDVEKVYFSVRLGNERKRIAEKVKPGEEILVMFSGCAPYPLVLSKNTKARNITGIEINPEGHKYALENLKLNKINNIVLINEDVHKAIPNILLYSVGLKSAAIPKEMARPLKDVKHTAHIYELHLFDNDLFTRRAKIERAIKLLQSRGIRVFMHMPFRHYMKRSSEKNIKDKKKLAERYSLARKDIGKELEMFNILGDICKKYDAKAIIHLNAEEKDEKSFDKGLVIENVKRLEKYFDWFYFETLTSGFSRLDTVYDIGKTAGIKNICIDLVHLYIMYQDNDRMIDVINKLKDGFNTYFHVADHNKITHTCEIGKGLIDWHKIAPLINTGVLEIESKDYIEDAEMIRSHRELNKYSHQKRFDRIIMPLPKTADEFLDDALKVSKKGTMIHFYDFLEEERFGDAITKIDAACAKHGIRYKILETVRCGQHAPHVFRICVDFEIL